MAMQSEVISAETVEAVGEGVVAATGAAACEAVADGDADGEADGVTAVGMFLVTAETFQASFFPFFEQTRLCPILLEAFEPAILQRSPGLPIVAADTPVICTTSPTMVAATSG